MQKSSMAAAHSSEAHAITALSVVFADQHEEPPYSFTRLEKSADAQVADINSGTGGRSVFLCTHRGEGAPIADIAVIFREKKETLPSSYHEVKHTPFGSKADLNSGQDGQTIFLVFRPSKFGRLQYVNNCVCVGRCLAYRATIQEIYRTKVRTR